MDSDKGNGSKLKAVLLRPPPPGIPSNVVPELEPVRKTALVPMARRGYGTRGQKIALLTNHFKVNFNFSNANAHFFQYSVAITYEDGSPAEAKGIGREILDQVKKTYRNDLGSKYFAYDGEKTLFTVGALPSNKLDFAVVLEDVVSTRNAAGTSDADSKRLKRPNRARKFNVAISYAAKIPMQAIANALQGNEANQLQDAIRVLDIILCQKAASQGCLVVRQSFFHNDMRYFSNIGEGIDCCKGIYSSFRTTQGGLSLNIDVSNTIIVHPGPVVNFLIANQRKEDPFSINWLKAKRTLKNLRVKVLPANQEYKITGLSEKICKDQTFMWKRKNEKGEVEEKEITVYYYFTRILNIHLDYSGDLPCINVGKPKRAVYYPVEQCELVSLQRYTKALTVNQRSNLVSKSRQKPQEKMNVLTRALQDSDYKNDSMLQECGVRISSDFTQVEGRVLPTPKLKAGDGDDLIPNNGRWNFNDKSLFEPTKISTWGVVNFSARCDIHGLVSALIRCGEKKGISISSRYEVIEENHRFKDAPGFVRVQKMMEHMRSKYKGPPQFFLCILSQRKNSDVYGPWKKEMLVKVGVVNQCIVPPPKVTDQYLTNVLLKINAKLGGLNSVLAVERSQSMPMVMKVPTMIIGMDVSHGSPGQSDVPSVAAVVGSREWPLVSKYRACVRTQPRKVEMIDNLFKPVSHDVDEGIMRELLGDFELSCRGSLKPNHIIIFRDGVSESQFNQVLNIELDQIMQACKFHDANWDPKFTVIIAQKGHHTKFFQTRRPDFNVPPGTIIDNKICHPRNNDFYLCAHAGMIGTSRPTHYHVLYDEIGFSTDDLQELVHSLSYVYQKSTTAISVVAPICYAHLAAAQMGTVMKFEDTYETSSSHGGSHSGINAAGAVPVRPMPKLHDKMASSMFFC